MKIKFFSKLYPWKLSVIADINHRQCGSISNMFDIEQEHQWLISIDAGRLPLNALLIPTLNVNTQC